jgi:NIMA (never in mitosis gene a)-related kinase
MEYEQRVENEQEYYRRIKLLGEGAYGKAFLAEYIKDKSLWVIKQVNMAELSPPERQ